MILQQSTVGKKASARDLRRWGAGLTAGSVGGGTAVRVKTKSRERAERAVEGGLAGQAAYQAAGYGAKHHALRRLEPKTTRSQRDKALKPVKREHGAFTPKMERNYPSHLPEAKVHRTLGWTHRGKTGVAAGTALTLTGAGVATGAMHRHDRGRKVTAAKAMYGVQEAKTEPSRVLEAGVGGGLALYGLSRMKMVGSLARYGARIAERNGASPKQVDRVLSAAAAVGRGTKATTGAGEKQLRRVKALNNAIEQVPLALRPAVATTAGIMLVQHARPVRQEHFTPYGRY